MQPNWSFCKAYVLYTYHLFNRQKLTGTLRSPATGVNSLVLQSFAPPSLVFQIHSTAFLSNNRAVCSPKLCGKERGSKKDGRLPRRHSMFLALLIPVGSSSITLLGTVRTLNATTVVSKASALVPYDHAGGCVSMPQIEKGLRQFESLVFS